MAAFNTHRELKPKTRVEDFLILMNDITIEDNDLLAGQLAVVDGNGVLLTLNAQLPGDLQLGPNSNKQITFIANTSSRICRHPPS